MNRTRAIALVVVVTSALMLAPACSVTKAPVRPETFRLVPGQGIFMLVNSTSEGASILRVAASQRPSGSGKLTLPAADWEHHPIGTEELVVSVHDGQGRLLGSYGFPTRRIAFYDSVGSKDGALQGYLRGLASVTQPVLVPYSPGAVVLYFWRTEILARDVSEPVSTGASKWRIEGGGPYGPVAFTVKPLGAFPLGKTLHDIQAIEFPLYGPAHEAFSKYIRDRHVIETPIGRFGPPLTTPCPTGTFASQNLGAGTPPMTSFNVAILGDGFTSAQMAAFQTAATSAKNALLARRPFSEFATAINVYRIDTPSTDSGVDQCPNGCISYPNGPCPGLPPDPKTTALEVYGDASGLGRCTEFDSDITKIYDATCSAFNPALADLYIVLVNCSAYGAMAYPATKTVYIATGFATNIIAHEVGHALAPIGEEYLGGVLPCLDPSCSSTCNAPVEFINVALPADVASNTVSWLPLAKPTELVSGKFKTIQKQSSGTCYENGGSPDGESQVLGLYWGAQYLTDGPETTLPVPACPTCRHTVGGMCLTLCQDVYCDERGASFYRPMRYCTMRFPEEPYCRVCYCAIRDALAGPTGLTPTTNWCP